MSRRRSRRHSRGAGEIAKYALAAVLTLGALGAAGATWYAFTAVERPPVLDKASYCPVDGPRTVTVMLLDATDELPAIGKQEARTLLLDRAEALPPYGLLEIRLLDPSTVGGRVIFSRCNPGDGSNLSEFTGNPQLARKRWQEAFRKPLEEVLQGGLQSAPGKTSPIMATVQGIAVNHFTGQANADRPKSLIIVSDMIEHGPDYSQYSGDLTFERYRRSPAYLKFRTDLHDASVTVMYVQRRLSRPLNSGDHAIFWSEWIRDNNGRLTDVIKLQGVE